MKRETTDRAGRPWLAYSHSNRRTLCAAYRPYHRAYDAANRATDGPCDCVNRSGVTIATMMWQLPTATKVTA